MRKFKIDIKYDGVGYEGFLHDNEELEVLDEENFYKMFHKQKMLQIMQETIGFMKELDLHHFEISKV